MGQPIAFFEILSTDHQRAQDFYAGMFGWQINADPAMGGYGLVDTQAGDGAINGGIGPADDAGTGVKIYIRVPDLNAALERADDLGGRTLAPLIELPDGYGQIAVFADPDGNAVGLWADANPGVVETDHSVPPI
jgi:uncharacterized protein